MPDSDERWRNNASEKHINPLCWQEGMAFGKSFIGQFVLGFGFLSGFWIRVGVSPQQVVISALGNFVHTSISPHPLLYSIFLVLPALFTTFALVGAWWSGGILGLIAVGLAFLAGMLVPAFVCIPLILGAIVLGAIAPLVKKKRR
jgi:hypothetical protein